MLFRDVANLAQLIELWLAQQKVLTVSEALYSLVNGRQHCRFEHSGDVLLEVGILLTIARVSRVLCCFDQL